jgi:RNA polymerase sigma-70 factor, ECF subfamily
MPLVSGELGAGEATRQRSGALQRSAEREFGELLLEQLPSLYSRARFLERGDAAADDLVQDTLERALRKFHRFERGTDLRRWLLVIMQNLFTDRWRERARCRGRVGDLANVADPLPRDSDVPSRSEVATIADVRQALTLVDEPLRTAFELRFFERLSYQEVAARTGVPVATVGTRILRARLRITNVVDQLELVPAPRPPAGLNTPSDA